MVGRRNGRLLSLGVAGCDDRKWVTRCGLSGRRQPFAHMRFLGDAEALPRFPLLAAQSSSAQCVEQRGRRVVEREDRGARHQIEEPSAVAPNA